MTTLWGARNILYVCNSICLIYQYFSGKAAKKILLKVLVKNKKKKEKKPQKLKVALDIKLFHFQYYFFFVNKCLFLIHHFYDGFFLNLDSADTDVDTRAPLS